MAAQEDYPNGVPPDPDAEAPVDGYEQHQSEHEDSGNSESDTDGTSSEGEPADFSGDEEVDAGNASERGLSLFVSPSPSLAAKGEGSASGDAESGDVEEENAQKQATEKKRSPRTAGMSPAGKKQKPEKPQHFRISQGTHFDMSDDERAAREEGLRHHYPRNEPKGSRKYAIVCRKRCGKHFMISDWGEPRRHYKTDEEGNFKHPGQPFNHEQFKYLSKVNAERRAKRCQQDGEETDRDSESESDVHENDYKGFDSVPGRPNADPDKIRKHSRPRKSKKATEDASGGEDTKEGKASGRKGAAGGTTSDCTKKCSLLQEALRAAQTEVERLVGVIAADRRQHIEEIIALRDEGILRQERAMELIENIKDIEQDQEVCQYRWISQVVPQLLAGAQEQVVETQETLDAFGFLPAEPIRSSSTAGLDVEGLTIDQPAPVLSHHLPAGEPRQTWNIDPSLVPHLSNSELYNGQLTSQQRMPPTGAVNNIIDSLQGALRSRGIELPRERALHILDQIGWVEAQVNQLLLDAEEGDWTPPAESMGGKADGKGTQGI